MRSLERMIEDQVGAWSINQRGTGGSEFRPVITISRSFGARGAALGHVLGQRTGFTVWDRELVQAIADKAGGDERVLETLDERRRTQINEAVRSLLIGSEHTNIKYFRSLMRIVRTIAAHGSAIIVGRGANYTLRPEKCLRVRVTAPIDWRIDWIATQSEMGRDEARQLIVQRDAERADFVEHYFRTDIEDAEAYDIVVNAGQYDLTQMADLVVMAYGKKFGRVPARKRAVLVTD